MNYVMFYFVNYSYSPNTAPTNRAMAIIRALSELGVPTKVVFFAPDKKHSRVEEMLPNIDFIYLWEKGYICLPRLNRFSLRFYLRRFVRNLQSGDKVYVYTFPELVVALSRRNDISVYVERTEHNEVSFDCLVKQVMIPVFLEACRKVSGVIVISQGLKQYYIESGCLPNRVHVVNMVVDTNRFKFLQKQPSEPYIAYCGTASNNKDGVDQLIKAFAFVAKCHPDYKLYIIGNTPSKKQRFGNYELIKELGIGDSVVFTGTIPNTQMPQMLKNAEILALDRPDNQQAKYGFPTKLGEYLLTGNPVVVTKVGDIPMYLKDGESALLAEPNNAKDFADKLCWAIENPDEAKSIGKNGRIVAEQNFNYLTETKKLVNIIFN